MRESNCGCMRCSSASANESTYKRGRVLKSVSVVGTHMPRTVGGYHIRTSACHLPLYGRNGLFWSCKVEGNVRGIVEGQAKCGIKILVGVWRKDQIE
jgi:hypothetical protein